MKTLLSFMLVFSAIFSAEAQSNREAEIHTRDGQYLGVLKLREISRDDARLDIKVAEDKINRIQAGTIANGTIYREHFHLRDGYIQYRQAQGGMFYESAFSPENVQAVIWPQSNGFYDSSAEKIARRMIVARSAHRSDRRCAAVVYAGLDPGNESYGYGDLFNSWYLISLYCDAQQSDDELLAVAAQRMGDVRKDGRRLVNMAPFDLPNP